MPDAVVERWTGSPPNGWQVLRRNRVAMLALWFVIAVAFFAVITPFCLREITKNVGAKTYQPPAWCQGGDRAHLLGTDANGRDLFYQIAVGAQVSLGVGLIGALVSLAIGGVYGMI